MRDKITFSQLMVTAFVGLLSPVIRLLPWASVRLSGGAAPLAAIPAMAMSALYIYIVYAIVKRRAGVPPLPDPARGGVQVAVAKLLCAALALWLTAYTAFTLRSGAERMVACVYTGGRVWVFSTVMAALAAFAASGGIKALAGAGRVMGIILTAVLVLLCLFAIPEVKPERFLPVTAQDAGNILPAAVPIFNVVSAGVYFLLLLGDVDRKTASPKTALAAAGGVALVSFAVIAVTVGAFSAPVTEKLQFPFFVLIRNIKVFKIIERFEALVIAMWIGADFVLLSGLLFIIRRLFAAITGRDSRMTPVIAAAVANGAGMLLWDSNFAVNNSSRYTIPALNLFFAVFAVPMLLLIKNLKKYEKRY
ncbi:MAG: GerAB/ArcD/ProY family transporter [Oscillospiraceae bacterium]|nr:GerAB/ArcD/ProY family transporter [Oscillospiraceae bacterium]